MAQKLGAKVFNANGILMFVSGIQMFLMPEFYFKSDMSYVPEFRLWNHMIAVQIFAFGFECLAKAEHASKNALTVNFCVWFMWLVYHSSFIMYSDAFKALNLDENTFIAWPVLCIIFMIVSYKAIADAPKAFPEKPLAKKMQLYTFLVFLMFVNVATLLVQPRVAINMYYPKSRARGPGKEFMENFLTTVGMFCLGKIPVYAELANKSTPYQDFMVGCEWLCWAAFFAYTLFIDHNYHSSIGYDDFMFAAWCASSFAFGSILLIRAFYGRRAQIAKNMKKSKSKSN